jgi:UDP-N-acetyl-D-glucosamine dehydrogenase
VNVVIIGLGYVGLPLAAEAVRVGLDVTGLDVKQATVDSLNAGRSHIDDLSDADVAAMRSGGFRAATDVADIAGDPDVIVICVPTPLSESDGPDLTAVKAATESAGTLLRGQGSLVVLESTTYPGTTDEIVRPLLEKASGLTAGIGFHLAFSPERIDPGNEVYGVRNTPKVVGGITPACTEAAADFYGHVCDTVVRAKSAREAEMAKLLENTYRHVNIALVNEMAIFCHELGVDLWDAIRCAATKPFGFQAFYPGPGVGGHCIPIDPNYLSYKVRAELNYPFRFVELAQEINSRMPGYIVDRAAELLNTHAKPLNGAKVLLLGVTYKRDIADQRESPARPIARKLLQRGAALSYHDPFVDRWQVDGRDIPRAAAPDDPADLTILLQAHSSYDLTDIAAKALLLFDTRGTVGGDSVFTLLCASWSARSCITPPTRGSTTARSVPSSTLGTRSRTSHRSASQVRPFGIQRNISPNERGWPSPPSPSRGPWAGAGWARCEPRRPPWPPRCGVRTCCWSTTPSCCWCCRRAAAARRSSGTCTRTPRRR